VFDGVLDAPDPQLMGLIQPDLLAGSISMNKSLGCKTTNNGVSLGGHRGAIGASLGSDKTAENPHSNGLNRQSTKGQRKNARSGVNENPASYA